jgi:transcriptional/translational regulatory protein YebC/TACO1
VVAVLVPPEDFGRVRDELIAAGLEPENAEVTMRPTTSAEVEGEDAEKVLRLLNTLDDLDDVQNVHSNAGFSGEVLAETG